MPDSTTIRRLLCEQIGNQLYETVDRIANEQHEDLLQVAITMLSSNENAERHAAALALLVLGDSRAVQPLLKAINDPRTEGYRGTLVYSLIHHDCRGLLPELLQLAIADQSFEVTSMALMGLQNGEFDCDAATIQWANTLLDDNRDRIVREVDRGEQLLNELRKILIRLESGLCE